MLSTRFARGGMNRRSFFRASAAAGVAVSAGGVVFAGESPLPPPPKPRGPKKLLFWDLARFDYWDNVELVQGRGVYRPEATFEDPDGTKGKVIVPSVWKEPSGRRVQGIDVRSVVMGDARRCVDGALIDNDAAGRRPR